jgi:hypothetical protein
VNPRPPYWCWLALNGHDERGRRLPPCDGDPVHAHLIKKQVLLRELPAEHSAAAYEDPRIVVVACGGPMGNGGHHGMLDQSKHLRIPRGRLPLELEEFAREHGLTWWLDREYGVVR